MENGLERNKQRQGNQLEVSCNDSDFKNSKAGCVTGSGRDRFETKYNSFLCRDYVLNPEGKLRACMTRPLHLEDRFLT